MERAFISNRTDFSSSGANASLETNEPQKIGTIIEVKSGSHKNMYKKLYRKEKNGKWRLIAKRKGLGGYYGGGNKSDWELIHE